MKAFKQWFRQPTTVAGFSALSGTLIALILKQMSLTEALPLLVGAVTSMLLPDNSSAKQEAVDLAKQVASITTQQKGTAI
jgi:hypothetical protein